MNFTTIDFSVAGKAGYSKGYLLLLFCFVLLSYGVAVYGT